MSDQFQICRAGANFKTEQEALVCSQTIPGSVVTQEKLCNEWDTTPGYPPNIDFCASSENYYVVKIPLTFQVQKLYQRFSTSVANLFS